MAANMAMRQCFSSDSRSHLGWGNTSGFRSCSLSMSNGSYTTSFFSNELGNRNLTSTEPPTIGSVAIFSAARLATRDTGANADTTACTPRGIP